MEMMGFRKGKKFSHAKAQRRKEKPLEMRQRFAPLREIRLA